MNRRMDAYKALKELHKHKLHGKPITVSPEKFRIYSPPTVHTVFRKAYILSGFHEFLYSIIESLRKIREIAEFIPNQLRFHEKKL